MADASTPTAPARPTTVIGAVVLALLSAVGWVGQEFVATREALARVEERQAVAIEQQNHRLDAIEALLRTAIQEVRK